MLNSENRGPGRPRTNHEKYEIMLSPEAHLMLNALAEKGQTTRSATVERLIREAIEESVDVQKEIKLAEEVGLKRPITITIRIE